MALAAILSAFRQLVLDGIELPPTQDERAALYSKKFQGLSPEEIEDLSKMDPARLKVYTSSVFMAEGGILSTAFPLTLAILRRSWPGSMGPFSPAEVAQRVHQVSPWRGIHSQSLGLSLRDFIEQQLAPLCKSEPELLEVVGFEQAALEIRKALNESVAPQSTEIFNQISNMKVQELLNCVAYVPTLLRCCLLHYDIQALRQHFLKTGELSAIALRRHALIGARPFDYGVLWSEVPESVASLMMEHRGEISERLTLEELAESYLQGASHQSEEEAFNSFLLFVQELVKIGALTIMLPESELVAGPDRVMPDQR